MRNESFITASYSVASGPAGLYFRRIPVMGTSEWFICSGVSDHTVLIMSDNDRSTLHRLAVNLVKLPILLSSNVSFKNRTVHQITISLFAPVPKHFLLMGIQAPYRRGLHLCNPILCLLWQALHHWWAPMSPPSHTHSPQFWIVPYCAPRLRKEVPSQ